MAGADSAIEEVLTRSGCEGWWCATRLSDGITIGRNQDEQIPVASLYKLRLMHIALEAIERGELNPRLRVNVSPTNVKFEGCGLASFDDPVSISIRDLLKQVASVSDNVAAHTILRLLPNWATEAFVMRFPDRMTNGDKNNSVTAEKELRQYVYSQGEGSEDIAFFAVSSLREINEDFAQIWRERNPSIRKSMLELLDLQVWRHRIPSGFPPQGVRVVGKTGTVGSLHGEASVVQIEGEEPIIVTIMLNQVIPNHAMRTHDGAIGEVARLLVDALR